jgi:hypothetical protein
MARGCKTSGRRRLARGVLNLAGCDPHDIDRIADQAGRFSPFSALGIQLTISWAPSFAWEATTMDLKDFNFKHWWTLMSAAGALIAAASVVPKSTLGLLAGLSLLFFGIGHWMNRPRTTVRETVDGLAGFRTADAYPWKPNFLGMVFEAIGVILFGLSAYWVVARQMSN